MSSFFSKKPKCTTCRKKFQKDDNKHIIRLETNRGIVELEICDTCADFWDLSADVLINGRKEDDG